MEPLIIGEIGSYAHGLNTADSDHDYIGLYADTPETLIGINPTSRATKLRDKPEGVKSEAGDEETTLYSLRHYTSLAAQGNPTLMTLLFTPTLISPDTIELQTNRDMFLSKRLVARHIGYADNMTARLTGGKAPRTNRPELVAAHGYDTKAAMHAIRLLMQGHEMLTTQTMQMPMRHDQRTYLLALRNGAIPKQEALNAIQHWKRAIREAETTTTLPDQPDYDRINRWLIKTHHQQWEQYSTASAACSAASYSSSGR